MKKRTLKQFLAGMLCVSLLAVNDGTAMVYAAAAENVQEEQSVEEADEREKETEEKPEMQSEDNELAGQDQAEELSESGAEDIIQNDVDQAEADEESDSETQEPTVSDAKKENVQNNAEVSEEETVEAELEGVYQFGNSPTDFVSEENGIETFALGDTSALEAYLYEQMLAKNTNINVSQYGILWEEIGDVVSGVLNEHADLYFVDKSYRGSVLNDITNTLYMTYDGTLDDNAFRKAVAAAKATVKAEMSDLEKAITLHDYLALNCEYDYQNYLDEKEQVGTIPATSYTAYGVFVNRTAVCEGYALAYKYMLNQVGIDCCMVKSDSMNHAWNLIKLGGDWYQVDVTWDDPTWDMLGRVCHNNMFRSDNGFGNHEGWKVTEGSSVKNYTARNEQYDNAFWVGCTSPLVIVGEDCYYTAYNEDDGQGEIRKNTLEGTGETRVCEIGQWTVWDSTSYWKAAYSGLFYEDGRLWYNDKESIYSIALDDSTDKQVEFTADISNGYIYGSVLRQRKVLYCLRQTPQVTQRETISESDITIVPKDIPVEYIGLSEYSLTLGEGETAVLSVDISPEDATEKDIVWSSSDKSVATVTEGSVAAVSEGSCTVTASAGGKSASCSVVVKPYTLTYDLDEDGTATITGYTGTINGDLVIPEKIAGHNVTAIGNSAFLDCNGLTGLTGLTIPNGVITIGNAAFSGCSALYGDLRIPDSVITIGDAAFSDCVSLWGKLTIGNGVTTIGDAAFSGCIHLSGDLTIPEGVTRIGDAAFSGCSGLSGNLTIPAGVTTIGDSSFSGCSELSGDLMIPAGVTTIGDEAFSGCSGLNGKLTIPEGITRIGDSSFSGCSSLSGNLTVPAGVTTIGAYAFYHCSGLNGELTIGNGVTTIGEYAFCGCWGLTGNLIIPEGVTTIGASAFNGCSGLSGELMIPDSVAMIGVSAFYYCNGLTGSLTIPSGITTIERDTFAYCSGLTGNLTIPEGVAVIGEAAFCGCRGFTGLTIPDGVTEIGGSAFIHCSGLTGSLTIPSGVTKIGYNAFNNCPGLTGKLTIPDSVMMIGGGAFKDCSKLTGSLTIPDSVTEIGSSTFEGCRGLTGSLTIPSGVTTIGASAFSGCSGLSGELTIPSGVTAIGASAFSGCSGLSGELTIPSGVATIERNAFSGCSGLNGELTIPSGVTTIGAYAFHFCSGLSGELTIPSGVTTIGDNAFGACRGLNGSLIIPDSVVEIQNNAFSACDGLSSIQILNPNCQIGELGAIEMSIIIFGYTNSTVEAYAEKNEMTFISFESLENDVMPLALIASKEKTEYKIGDSFNTDDIKVTVKYTDGSVKTVTEFSIDTLYIDMSEVGRRNLIVSYYDSEKDIEISTSINIEVKDPSEIVESTFYTVTFNANGGTGLSEESRKVEEGKTLGSSPEVKRTGYTFTGWYKDAECKTKWDFAVDVVTGNTVLYAGWKPVDPSDPVKPTDPSDPVKPTDPTDPDNPSDSSYTVSFNLQGHGTMEDITVTSGNKVSKPSDPTAAGYTFTGWYKEAACTTPWDFAADVVTGNTVLYAGWKSIEIVYTVSFDLQGYGAVGNATVISGSKLEKPSDPVAAGHIFTGWYKEAACENLWNFGADIVTEDITLYAGWETDEAFEGVFVEDTKDEKEGFWVAAVDSCEYTGKAVKPVIRVYYGDRKLDLGIDYTVSYKNNTNAATDGSPKPPTITVKGRGIYAKEKVDPIKFTIRPVDLNSSKITAEDIELVVAKNNKVQKKIPVLTFNGKKLANKKDFTLPADYQGYSEGEHDLTVTAKEGGNFTGTRTVHISIRQGISMSRVKIGKIASEKYTGSEITPKVEVTVGKVPLEESNYTVQYFNNTEIGTATVIVKGRGDYVGTKKATFKITGDSLKKATITGIKNGDNIYNGLPHRPVEVKLGGVSLRENVDYKVSYTNNKNAGKAGVTITGIKKYTGTVKKTFKITAYDLGQAGGRIGGLEGDITVPYAGKKGSKPVLNLTFDGKVLREGRDYTLTCKNNKAVTTDDMAKQPTVTIKGKGNFKGKISDIPFKIVDQDK